MRRRTLTWAPFLAVLILYPTALYTLFAPHAETVADRQPTTEEDLGPSISRYDSIIKKYARENGIDWRLVASMIFTESSFREDVVSHAGAKGLMQIMPVVAKEHGATKIIDPEENIRTGIVHLLKKLRRLHGETPDDVIQLSLAAYNSGLGHLRDAQNLLIQQGKNPRIWKNVREAFLKLEDPRYYADAKYGYCRGSETVEYVSRVLRRYRKYEAMNPSPTFDGSLSMARLNDPGV